MDCALTRSLYMNTFYKAHGIIFSIFHQSYHVMAHAGLAAEWWSPKSFLGDQQGQAGWGTAGSKRAYAGIGASDNADAVSWQRPCGHVYDAGNSDTLAKGRGGRWALMYVSDRWRMARH